VHKPSSVRAGITEKLEAYCNVPTEVQGLSTLYTYD
jgi:hypothetical protein